MSHVVIALNAFGEIKGFNIIWAESCACLFNYTFALGVDSQDVNEMTLFIVHGTDDRDMYEALDTYHLSDYQGNSNRLLEYIKVAMANRLKSALMTRVSGNLLTIEQVERMARN